MMSSEEVLRLVICDRWCFQPQQAGTGPVWDANTDKHASHVSYSSSSKLEDIDA